jgi:hypothetical protein
LLRLGGGPVGQQPGRLDLGCHVGDLQLDGLEVRDRLTERRPLPRVPQRRLVRRLGDADRARRDVDPADLQAVQDLLQAAALLAAEQVDRRDADLVEDQLAGLRALVAELGQVPADREAGRVRVDEQDRHAFVRLGRIFGGLDQHGQDAGHPGVRDPRLGPADHVVVAVFDRGGHDALQVGPGARLGERDARAELAGGHLRQVPFLLLVGATAGDQPAGHRVRAEQARRAQPRARDLLEGEGVGDAVGAEAAVLFGDVEAEEAQFPELAHDLRGIAASALPFGGDRHDLLVGEFPQRLPEEALLVGQLEVHGAYLPVHVGVRRSANARAPSIASALLKTAAVSPAVPQRRSRISRTSLVTFMETNLSYLEKQACTERKGLAAIGPRRCRVVDDGRRL